MKRIIVIGSGVAGLGAALKVRRAAAEGHDVDVLVIERDDRVGGKIAGETVATEYGDFLVDGGPDCFVTMKPAVMRIAKLTGIAGDKLPSDESRKKTLILKKGRLYAMPDGVMQFAPTKFWPFATTGLFSWPGKLRAGMDLFVPKKRVPEGELNDETLGHFIRRRMGNEILDRLAEPLVGGVHGSDPDMMSLAATFPNLLEMEQKYGTMIRGFLAQRRAAEEMRRKYPPDPKNPRTFFTSFTGGMHELTTAMADAVGRERMRLGTEVASLTRTGGGWSVALSDGTVEDADAVIVATEGWAAEPLMRPLDAQIADALAEIPASTSATVSIGFRATDIDIDLNAFGVLCPQVENVALLAATYSSTKWPGRAPEGCVLFRGFAGGPRNQKVVEGSPEEITDVVLGQLRTILKLGTKAEPIFTRAYKWHLGMPQYTTGHLGRVELIERRAAETPGLALAGGSYRGVGIPNCIESGEAATSKVLGEWGISLAEDAVEEKRSY